MSFGFLTRANADDETPNARRIVRVVVASDDAQAAALDASLRAMVVKLALVLEERRAERLDLDDPAALAVPSPDALATAWIDLRAPSHATVVLVDDAGHVVEKRMVPSEGSAAIAIESVAQIVATSVEDIVVHTPPPPVVVTPPPPPPPPLPPKTIEPTIAPAAPTRFVLFGDAFIAGSTFGGDEPVVAIGGLGATASLERASLRPSLRAWIASDVPFSISGPLVALDAATLSARVAPTLRLLRARTISIEAGASGGVDVLWISPRGTGLPAGFVASQSASVSPMVGALASVRIAVSERVDFVSTLACDFDLMPRRYVIDDGARVDVVFQPWPVRPSFSIGFDFLLAGRR